VICPEEEGGFSVFALNYPGVISQGETFEEAKANITEAFLAVLESRRKHGEAMEFSESPTVDITPDSQRIRVTIDG
jgi:predicted RNase H-like HicB family nuclease